MVAPLWVCQSELHVYTHWTPEQVNNKCALPNRLKGPKIILNMADRYVVRYTHNNTLHSVLLCQICSRDRFRIRIRTNLFYEIRIRRMRIFVRFVTALIVIK